MLPKAPDSITEQDEDIFRQMAKFDQKCLDLIRATDEALSSDGEGDYGYVTVSRCRYTLVFKSHTCPTYIHIL